MNTNGKHYNDVINYFYAFRHFDTKLLKNFLYEIKSSKKKKKIKQA